MSQPKILIDIKPIMNMKKKQTVQNYGSVIESTFKSISQLAYILYVIDFFIVWCIDLIHMKNVNYNIFFDILFEVLLVMKMIS